MSLPVCVVSILVLNFTVSWIVLAPPVIKQPRSCPPTTTTQPSWVRWVWTSQERRTSTFQQQSLPDVELSDNLTVYDRLIARRCDFLLARMTGKFSPSLAHTRCPLTCDTSSQLLHSKQPLLQLQVSSQPFKALITLLFLFFFVFHLLGAAPAAGNNLRGLGGHEPPRQRLIRVYLAQKCCSVARVVLHT